MVVIKEHLGYTDLATLVAATAVSKEVMASKVATAFTGNAI